MASNDEKAIVSKFEIIDRLQAFDGLVRQMDIKAKKPYRDLQLFTNDLLKFLQTDILNIFTKKSGLTCFLTVNVVYQKVTNEVAKKINTILQSGEICHHFTWGNWNKTENGNGHNSSSQCRKHSREIGSDY